MIPASPGQESARALLTQFFHALDTRCWPEFAACFEPAATVFLSDEFNPDDVLPWPLISLGWREVFRAEAQNPSPLLPGYKLDVEVRGEFAFAAFRRNSRPQSEGRAVVLRMVEGSWLIHHLHVQRLPLRSTGQAAVQQRPRKRFADDTEAAVPAWFAPLLVASLITIALLAGVSDRRSAVQLSTAVLAVFFGAVAVLRDKLGVWFHGGAIGKREAAPITGSGALVMAVGAAFLVT